MKGKELNVLLTEWEPSDGGAEEILDKYPHSIEYPSFVHENSAIAAMTEFATLHAQRIADKMVSERLREELGLYNDWLNGAAGKYLTSPYIDEYLTSEYYLKTREK